MGKEKHRDKKKHPFKKGQSHLLKSNTASSNIISPKAIEKKKYIKRLWQKIPMPGKALVWIGLILSLVLGIKPIRELFLSSHQIYVKDKFTEGDLKSVKFSRDAKGKTFAEYPPAFYISPMIDTFPRIKGLAFHKMPNANGIIVIIGISATYLPYSDLEKGIEFPMPMSSTCIQSSNLFLITKDDRLYISAEFIDLENQEHIGIMEYNHWRLFIPNLLDWNYDDDKLQIWDKQRHIVCAISTDGGKELTIAGYFISPNSIWVLGNESPVKTDTCFSKTDSDWKQRALVPISKIKSIF